MIKKGKSSLVLEIVGISIGLLLLSSVTLSVLSYNRAKTTIVESVGNTILNMAEAMAKNLDINAFQELQNADDMNSETYTQFYNNLNNLRISFGLKFLYTMRMTEDGKYMYVVDGSAEDDPDKSDLGDFENIELMSDAWIASFQGKSSYELDISNWGDMISIYVPFKDETGNVIGILGADMDATQITDNIETMRLKNIFNTIIIAIIGIIIAGTYSIKLSKTLKELKTKVEFMQQGDLTVKIINKRKDELGSLASSINILGEDLCKTLNNITKRSADVTNLSTNVSTISQQIAASSEETSSSIGEITKGTTDQAQELAIILAELDDFDKMVKNIYTSLDAIKENSELTESLSSKGSNQMNLLMQSIQDSKETFGLVSNKIGELNDSIMQIDDINHLIESIAEQTNLLSLNASIEAARAGDAGRGFSVVADEIRKLAEQSKKATININNTIDGILTGVKNVVTTSDELRERLSDQIEITETTNESFNSILDSLKGAAPKIKHTFDSADSILSSKNDIIERVQSISAVAVETSAASEEIAASSEELNATTEETASIAQNLQQMAYELLEEVKVFKIQ